MSKVDNVEKKYVIVDSTFPVVFMLGFHKDFLHCGNISSAAFYKVINGRVVTYGHSNSLRMGPKDEDARIIEIMLGYRTEAGK